MIEKTTVADLGFYHGGGGIKNIFVHNMYRYNKLYSIKLTKFNFFDDCAITHGCIPGHDINTRCISVI
jgi:hypothetical protein